MKRIRNYILVASLVCVLGSCKKFLDEKPRLSLNVPSTFSDLQSLLDNSRTINKFNYGTSLIEVIADDYYMTYGSWQNIDVNQQQNYVWGNMVYEQNNWDYPYKTIIYTSNVVLDQISEIKGDVNISLRNQVEGTALFLRAFAFFQLAQVYCKPHSETSNNDLGIVLRTTSSLEAKSTRSTVSETYAKIITDLNKAAELLPEKSGYATRPNKAAAFAALSRVYLSKRDYSNALTFSNKTLSLNDKLLNYNTLPQGKLPVYTENPEILFFSTLTGSVPTNSSNGKIDSNLYKSYKANDIRRTLFFLQNTGVDARTYRFNGSYDVRGNVFTGLTTAEQYLIKAECLARIGNTNESMMVLNILLNNRYQKSSFINLVAGNSNEAKEVILLERRKELVFRGIRWSDLRRFNLEGENITLKRVLNGISYTLPPNDLRWVIPIPTEEIDRSGIPQNNR